VPHRPPPSSDITEDTENKRSTSKICASLGITSENTYVHHILHMLSSTLSDHLQLLFADDSGPKSPRRFNFENFWTSVPGFEEIVQRAWSEPTGIVGHIMFCFTS
jgi:hypothetical protein